jgi:hypothetical protein
VLILTDGGSITSGADQIYIGEMGAGAVKTVEWTVMFPHSGTYNVVVEVSGIDSNGNPCAVSGSTSVAVSSGLPTDLNKNGIVDIEDIVIAAAAFDASPGDPNWNEAADLDNNGIIDILDIYRVAKDFKS